MRDEIRRRCWSFVGLPILVLLAWGCEAARLAPRAPELSAPFVDMQPCCEREQIHDLYAAPYRRAQR